MNTQQFKELLAERAQVSLDEASAFVDAWVAVIVQEVQQGGRELYIKGYGNFRRIDTQNGQRIAYTPDEAMRKLINAPFDCFEPYVIHPGHKAPVLTENATQSEAETPNESVPTDQMKDNFEVQDSDITQQDVNYAENDADVEIQNENYAENDAEAKIPNESLVEVNTSLWGQNDDPIEPEDLTVTPSSDTNFLQTAAVQVSEASTSDNSAKEEQTPSECTEQPSYPYEQANQTPEHHLYPYEASTGTSEEPSDTSERPTQASVTSSYPENDTCGHQDKESDLFIENSSNGNPILFVLVLLLLFSIYVLSAIIIR